MDHGAFANYRTTELAPCPPNFQTSSSACFLVSSPGERVRVRGSAMLNEVGHSGVEDALESPSPSPRPSRLGRGRMVLRCRCFSERLDRPRIFLTNAPGRIYRTFEFKRIPDSCSLSPGAKGWEWGEAPWPAGLIGLPACHTLGGF